MYNFTKECSALSLTIYNTRYLHDTGIGETTTKHKSNSGPLVTVPLKTQTTYSNDSTEETRTSEQNKGYGTPNK